MADLCRQVKRRIWWHRLCRRSTGMDDSLYPGKVEMFNKYDWLPNPFESVFLIPYILIPRIGCSVLVYDDLPSTSSSISTYVNGLGAFSLKSSPLKIISSDSRRVCLETLQPIERRKCTAILLLII